MMLLKFLFLLLVCGGSVSVVYAMLTSKVKYHMEEAEALFEKFILDYNKTYEHETEKQLRLEIFKSNMQKINEENMKLKEPVYGITKFADLTLEELKQYKGYGLVNATRESCDSVLEEISIGAAPESFDWRDQNVVTPVKDQGRCGSCWTFSTTGNVEGQYAIKHQDLVELSEQQILDCVSNADGCDGGFVTNAMNYLKNNNGAESEDDYPYVGQVQQCQNNPNLNKVTVTGCTEFTGIAEDQLKETLYQYGPLSVSVCAYHWELYSGGIMTDCPACKINHAVLLVGYGSENGIPFWIIKNSWGVTHGEQGYFRIIRGQNACNIIGGMIVTAVVA